MRDYCAAEKIEFTRCRPYRKNDQAHVEQKNGEIVRRMVGYRRYEGLAAAEQLARLYSPARLFVNAFQPCFKLAEKTRDGATVKKRYHKPLTPCDRLLTDARVDTTSREHIAKLRTDLDPVRLLAEIRSAQQALVTLADAAWIAASKSEQLLPLDSFVSGLRTAWHNGEVRPTSQPPDHGVVLATVKVWPVDGGASIEVGATANLDGVCARRQRTAKPGWTTARCAASRHLTKRAEKYLGNKVE